MLLMARYWGYWALAVILLSACSAGARSATQSSSGSLPASEQASLLERLARLGAAPELANQVWLNSPPLRLADLRGKVVVIDFWTFG